VCVAFKNAGDSGASRPPSTEKPVPAALLSVPGETACNSNPGPGLSGPRRPRTWPPAALALGRCLRRAAFDPTGLYRYTLTRGWDWAAPRIVFIMLNPSTADAARDDPTIRRCMGFARRWGFGVLHVVNLFAFRTSHVRQLRPAADPIGPGNDRSIVRALRCADAVLAAWGRHGRWRGRDEAVLARLAGRAGVYCLGLTTSGDPRHPLYVRADARPVLMTLARSVSQRVKVSGHCAASARYSAAFSGLFHASYMSAACSSN